MQKDHFLPRGNFESKILVKNWNSRAARYPKVISTNQEFNVNQDLKGAVFDGQFVYQATVDVSDLGDIRTLKIEPKHGISGIYAR